MAMATTSAPLEFEVGTPLFYVVVGAGSILVLLTLCIGLLCLSIIIFVRRNFTRPAAFNSNQQIEFQENSEVHNSTLSKEGRSKKDAGTQTTSVDHQIEPQCYTIEENPAYTTTRQDLFNCEGNPAYTQVEKQGIPIYHVILNQPMKQ